MNATTNRSAEGYVYDDEARARRLGQIPALLDAAGDALVEELIVDLAEIDYVALPDGRYVVRAAGLPTYVADLSTLDADAHLVLDDEDEILYGDEFGLYSTAALVELRDDAMADLDGDVENGPRNPSDEEVASLAALRRELDRRQDESTEAEWLAAVAVGRARAAASRAAEEEWA